MKLELTFGNDRIHRPSVLAFLNVTLGQFSLDVSSVEKLETFVVGAIDNAIDHAYPLGDDGVIRLSIQEEHGELEIRVRDYGYPKDVQSLEQQLHERRSVVLGPWGALDAEVADEVHWLSFGPEGKAIQILKWLNHPHIRDGLKSESNSIQATESSVRHADESVVETRYTVRRMLADESEKVSQLMYRIYGSTYFNADVYYPDRIAGQNARGDVLSYVAVGEDDGVAGHYALKRHHAGRVAEGGQAAVDAAHRGRGLMSRMKDHALDEARRLALSGWYADAVTVHTRTQASNVKRGGQLTAVELGIAPRKERFDAADEQPQRVTCLLYFHWLKPPEARLLHVPTRHQEIVESIYARLDCPIRFGDGSSPAGHGSLAIKVDAGALRANVCVEVIGGETIQQIREARRDLVERSHLEVVYVDLPMADRATAYVAEQLESAGFGFLGVGPDFSKHGDVLRLAYLVEPVAREAIQVVDDVAGELVDYVVCEQARVRGLLK